MQELPNCKPEDEESSEVEVIVDGDDLSEVEVIGDGDDLETDSRKAGSRESRAHGVSRADPGARQELGRVWNAHHHARHRQIVISF